MDDEIYFFKCSVSDDLYGVCKELDGSTLPTPGGGNWLPLRGQSDLGDAKAGYIESECQIELQKWGCHWFTSNGTVEVVW